VAGGGSLDSSRRCPEYLDRVAGVSGVSGQGGSSVQSIQKRLGVSRCPRKQLLLDTAAGGSTNVTVTITPLVFVLLE